MRSEDQRRKREDNLCQEETIRDKKQQENRLDKITSKKGTRRKRGDKKTRQDETK